MSRRGHSLPQFGSEFDESAIGALAIKQAPTRSARHGGVI